jgi:hypothetical protein
MGNSALPNRASDCPDLTWRQPGLGSARPARPGRRHRCQSAPACGAGLPPAPISTPQTRTSLSWSRGRAGRRRRRAASRLRPGDGQLRHAELALRGRVGGQGGVDGGAASATQNRLESARLCGAGLPAAPSSMPLPGVRGGQGVVDGLGSQSGHDHAGLPGRRRRHAPDSAVDPGRRTGGHPRPGWFAVGPHQARDRERVSDRGVLLHRSS